ncbi:MAG: tRNA (adenosine(37)-N6)-dimethylallyltransferase MiaA [Gallionellaceae bacterium]|nr:tRNA (adenosine(37)-N6)-dimethylallyltransferase MiaA [Gallionellaceae bacterium]
MGPTASGKTDVAVELAQSLPVEIISVDSALVYRGMDIGTAKPDAATLARAPHHLIDIRDPTEAYSAAAFCHDALHLMQDITRRGRIPLLVGGTMLYFKALREGLSQLPEADAAVRAELDAETARHGIQYLHHQLAQVDAETAARLAPGDTQRIQRALEIYRLSGRPMSELLRQQTSVELPYRVLPLALIPGERSVLHQRIALRFGKMLEQGLVEELHGLRQRYDLHPDLPSMRCVGYRQAWQFIEGEISAAQLLETGTAATRQLAKRQLTWLRSMPDNIKIDRFSGSFMQQVYEMLQPFMRS